jgi:DNA polymerase-3 subunit gamma/tau
MIDPIFLDNIFKIILEGGDINSIIKALENYETGQVLDEISIYLKERILDNDIKFTLDNFDNFIKIIADGKQLLNMNSDGEFVLILTFSKMVASINGKKEKQEIVQPTVAPPLKVVNPLENSNVKYNQLIALIYNKAEKLGDCFQKSFKFVSYQNNILTIDSVADKICKSALYQEFQYIKECVSNIYGYKTIIEFNKISQTTPKDMVRINESVKHNNQQQLQENNQKINRDNPHFEEQPSSCIANMSAMRNPNMAQRDLTINDVLNSKMVQTALNILKSPNPPQIRSKL